MKTLIMIPTYNEAENIVGLVEEVLSQSPDIGVVVVDDNSPDGTYTLVSSIEDKKDRIHLIVRENEKGRGSAGICGFKYILENFGEEVEFIGEMDADFSHDPKYLKVFLKELKNCDIVIGSRMTGGGSEEGRGFVRRFITSFAAIYIRLILGIRVKDTTSGYRLFKREVLRSLDWEAMISDGPSIVQEILHQALLKGAHVKEVPILFSERKAGEAKFNWKIGVSSLIMIIRFRFRYGKHVPRSVSDEGIKENKDYG